MRTTKHSTSMRRARAHVTKSSAIRNILIYMGIDSMILIQQLR